MAYLDGTGLSHLIGRIQDQVIATKTYTGLAGTDSAMVKSSIFFMKISRVNNSPWIVKYRITSTIPSSSNSELCSTVIIGGEGATLSFYQAQNIVYDTALVSASNHIVMLNASAANYAGLNFGSTYNQSHTLTIELQYIYGCSVQLLTTPNIIENIVESSVYSTGTFKQFSANTNGTVSDETEGLMDELADVAFSGEYSDLKHRFEATYAEETAIFYKTIT